MFKTTINPHEFPLRDTYRLGDFYDDWYKIERTGRTSKSRYMKIARMLLEKISRVIIEEQAEFTMPRRLGKKRIKLRNLRNKKVVDFAKTKEMGEVVYYPFEENRPIYVWHWNKNSKYANFKYRHLYRYKVADGNERMGKKGLNNFVRDSYNDPDRLDYELL